jgi:hypothetical protein
MLGALPSRPSAFAGNFFCLQATCLTLNHHQNFCVTIDYRGYMLRLTRAKEGNAFGSYLKEFKATIQYPDEFLHLE